MTAGCPTPVSPARAGADAALMALPSFLPARHRSAAAVMLLVAAELEQLQGQVEVLIRLAEVRHAQPSTHRERADVGRFDDRDDPVQAAGAEGQRDGAAASLGRIPVAPVIRVQVPADLDVTAGQRLQQY